MVTKERLKQMLSFIPFFSIQTKKGVMILNDYLFMNPEFFSKDDINSETKLTAEQTWYLIDERKSEFILKAFNTIIIYESQLQKLNARKFLMETLNIEEADLNKSFINFFVDFELNDVKQKYGFDIKEFYEKYIEGK